MSLSAFVIGSGYKLDDCYNSGLGKKHKSVRTFYRYVRAAEQGYEKAKALLAKLNQR